MVFAQPSVQPTCLIPTAAESTKEDFKASHTNTNFKCTSIQKKRNFLRQPHLIFSNAFIYSLRLPSFYLAPSEIHGAAKCQLQLVALSCAAATALPPSGPPSRPPRGSPENESPALGSSCASLMAFGLGLGFGLVALCRFLQGHLIKGLKSLTGSPKTCLRWKFRRIFSDQSLSRPAK